MQINFHSAVDLITNSSTTIFTDYSDSVQATYELLSEIVDVFGVDVNVREAFSVFTLLDEYTYGDHYEDVFEEEYEGNMSEFYAQVKSGEVKKPEWMTKIEEILSDDPNNTIIVLPKEEKYKALCDKIQKLLLSVDCDATYE